MAANPLKILSDLHVSGSAVFKEEVTILSQKITGLAAGTAAADAVNYGQLSTETSRAQSVEASLSTGLSSEASRAGSAEASLSGQVSSEQSRAQSAEASLSTGLSSEVSRAGSAEASLSSGISSEASRAGSVEASLETRLAAEESNLTAEVSRAQSAEASLSTGLSSEASRAGSAEASLSTAASTAVSAEASRAGSAEASLSTSLSSEASRAASAEASVSAAASTAVSSEASRAASAEASLSTGLSSEASRAGSAEGSLSSAVSAEASRAGSAEASLSTSLSTENSRAVSAEGSLTTRISAEESRAASVEASIATNFLKIDGSNAMTGDLNMGGQDITNAKDGNFSGDVTIHGSLLISGSVTAISKTNLDVEDAKVTIAKGAANLTAAGETGIFVGSDSAPLAKFSVDANGLWISSGSAGLGIVLTGSNDTGLFATGSNPGVMNVEGTFRNLGTGVFQQLAGHANRYAAARVATEVSLNANGEGTYNFSTAPFADTEMGKIAVDVMVSGAAGYSNDLVSVYVKAAGGYASLEITAPAAPNGKVRVVAVNEAWGLSSGW